MSETEISQTPEGRPPEGRPPESRPPESDLPGAPSTSAPNPVAAPGVARLAEEPAGGSRKPKIGDTRPARVRAAPAQAGTGARGPAGPAGGHRAGGS